MVVTDLPLMLLSLIAVAVASGAGVSLFASRASKRASDALMQQAEEQLRAAEQKLQEAKTLQKAVLKKRSAKQQVAPVKASATTR